MNLQFYSNQWEFTNKVNDYAIIFFGFGSHSLI